MSQHKGTNAPEQASAGADAGKTGIEIVLLQKDGGGQFAKSYHLDEHGDLQATPAPDLFSNLTARRVKLDAKNPLQLLQLLQKIIDQHMKGDMALAMGRVPKGVPDKTPVPIILSGRDGEGDHGVDWVHRTKEDFDYAKGAPVVLPFDFDLKSYPPAIRAAVDAAGGPWEALLQAVPELKDVTVLSRPSTSTGIMRSADGHVFPRGGLHVYVVLSDGRDAKKFMQTIRDRLWMEGFGYPRVTGGGRIQKWSIIDHTIWMPQQPIYEAPPSLGEGLKQVGRVGQIIKGSKTFFDVKKDLKPADPVEVDLLFEQAKGRPEVQDEADRAREVWIRERAARDGVTESETEVLLDSMLDWDKVALQTVLAPANAGLGNPTVAEVLLDIGRWDGTPIADPIEGPAYGPQTAKVFENAHIERPKINSHAHGGVAYPLHGYDADDVVEAVKAGVPAAQAVEAARLGFEAVEDVLSALAGEGFTVSAADQRKCRDIGRVETISRRAAAVSPFALHPVPDGEGTDPDGAPLKPLAEDIGKGLAEIARKRKPKNAPTNVKEWLDRQKGIVAERLGVEMTMTLRDDQESPVPDDGENGAGDPSTTDKTEAETTAGTDDPDGGDSDAGEIAVPVPQKFPTELTQIDGLVGDLFDYYQGKRWKLSGPAPDFAAALQTVDLIASNRFMINGATTLGKYILNLGESGLGKTSTKNEMVDIATALGLPDGLIQGFPGSAPGFAAHLARTQNQTPCGAFALVVIDEIGLKLQAAVRNGTMKEVFAGLLEFFGQGASKVTPKDTYRNQQSIIPTVNCPAVSIHAYSTPTVYTEALTSGDVGTGDLPRQMVVVDREGRDRRHKKRSNAPMDPKLMQALRTLLGEAKKIANTQGFPTTTDDPVPSGHVERDTRMFRDVPLSDKAVTIFDAFTDEIDDMQDGTLEKRLANRAFLNVLSVAGTLALGDWVGGGAKGDPAVSPQNMRAAILFVRWTHANAVALFEEDVADSEHEAQRKRILAIIRRADTLAKLNDPWIARHRSLIKKGWVPRSVITRKSKLKSQQIDEALRTLLDAEEIAGRILASTVG